MKKEKNNQQGFAAIFVTVLVLSVVSGIVAFLTGFVVNEERIMRGSINSSKSYYASESGLEDAVYRVKNGKSLPSNYNFIVASSSVSVTVESPSPNNKMITALGNSFNDFRKLQVEMSTDVVNPTFYYGVQVGTLGLEMEQGARVEGIGGQSGNIYSNGPIQGENGSTITGNVLVATGMQNGESNVIYNADQIFGRISSTTDTAQSFKPSFSEKLVKVSLYLKKSGSPRDATVRIMTDSSGSPSKTQIGSATLQSNLVSGSYGFVDVVFSTPPSLTQNTTYWLLIDVSWDSNDYYIWGKDNNGGYANGSAKSTDDYNASHPVWFSLSGDLDFKTFMGGSATFIDDVAVLGDAHANTITNSKICGDAYYYSIDSSSLTFLNNPSKNPCLLPLTPGTGYPQSSDPPLQNMPISDSNINSWKDEAAANGTYSGDLVVSKDMSFGPKKVAGDLIMTSNNKTLTLTGTVYITGSIEIDNGSTIKCSPSYGLRSCVIVADSWIHISNNGIFSGSGTPGSYILILTTSNCDGTFSGGCGNHKGAIDLHNGAVGAIFYANDGYIYLHNEVIITEIVAKKIHLAQGATIRYEQGLQSANFSSGPGGSWNIIYWKEIE